MKRPTITALAGVTTLVLGAGLASGALTLKKSKEEVTLAGGEQALVAAKCKQGFRAVGGGFDDPGRTIDADDSYVMPFASERTGRREWSSLGYQFNDSGTFVSFVYCSDDLPRLKAVETTETIGPGNGSVTATCPRGEAVSGGFTPSEEALQSPTFWTWGSHRTAKREWTVDTWNNTGTAHEFTGFAYCAKHKLGLKERSAATGTDLVEEQLTATARCKKNSRAVSGGFEGAWDAGHDDFTEISGSRRAGKRGWKASTSAFSGIDPVPWTAFVYCLKKDALG